MVEQPKSRGGKIEDRVSVKPKKGGKSTIYLYKRQRAEGKGQKVIQFFCKPKKGVFS